MKNAKLLFLIIGLAIYQIGLAQNIKFILTNAGTLVNQKDSSDFVVVNFDGKSKNEIFEEALKAVTMAYNSPKDIISKVENEMISINGTNPSCTVYRSLGIPIYFGMDYVIKLQFKDGKMRINAPYISRWFADNAPNITPFSGWLKAQSVFKNGKPNPKKQYTIDGIEGSFNNLLNSISASMFNQNKESW